MAVVWYDTTRTAMGHETWWQRGLIFKTLIFYAFRFEAMFSYRFEANGRLEDRQRVIPHVRRVRRVSASRSKEAGGDGDEDERMAMRDYVCSCLGEAIRVREEMKDIGLKARIAKEVEANHKRIKKELEKKDVDYSKKTHNYFVQNEGENVSSDTASHSTTIVDNQKNRLMSTTKELKLVLTMRTEALRLTRARYYDLLAKCDMVTEGNSFSQSGGRSNMSQKLMKKSKGGESGGTSGESYGKDGYSEYQDGFAAPHMSFLRYLTMLQYRLIEKAPTRKITDFNSNLKGVPAFEADDESTLIYFGDYANLVDE
ncbi:hypothetical protein Tco_1192990 [Tanacetum coccineum]